MRVPAESRTVFTAPHHLSRALHSNKSGRHSGMSSGWRARQGNAMVKLLRTLLAWLVHRIATASLLTQTDMCNKPARHSCYNAYCPRETTVLSLLRTASYCITLHHLQAKPPVRSQLYPIQYRCLWVKPCPMVLYCVGIVYVLWRNVGCSARTRSCRRNVA